MPPAATETHLAPFAYNACIYPPKKYERRVVCKLQRGLAAVKSWCEHWNMKINERNIQAIIFSRILTVPEFILQLQG
jgi:hypothetical protein